MVDTLVLGTSAKAWEFESLHAQLCKKNLDFSLKFFFFVLRDKDENSHKALPCRSLSANEQRAEAWRQNGKAIMPPTVDPFNASEQGGLFTHTILFSLQRKK